MNQVSANVMVLYPGEIPPPGCEDAIKLMLVGSVDARPDGKFDWGGKFINGLVDICDPVKGILQYRGLRFLVFNSVVPSSNPGAPPTVDNEEFVGKTNWMIQSIGESDLIFCNFLKKSTNPFPLFWLGLMAQTGKLVVRCPDQYMGYGLVQVVCKNYNIPLMPGKVGSVLAIVQAMNTISDVFNLKQDKNQLPE